MRGGIVREGEVVGGEEESLVDQLNERETSEEKRLR